MVMQQCREHLRGACGNALDKFDTEKYPTPSETIVVGDCVEQMKLCVEWDTKFDFIFGDLTDIPINTLPEGELWDFVLNIIELAFSCLAPGGVFLTHATGAASKESLQTFETAVLGKLGRPVRFTRSEAYVPSFMEKWVFYQIRVVDSTSDDNAKAMKKLKL